jgi:hypothetical protein
LLLKARDVFGFLVKKGNSAVEVDDQDTAAEAL